ncbi:hypothetical protein MPSEU_000968600 [Mayamaea pseudoterrestris]|nr:hypothetical protein MPSEU_000968600 [Mayamaea pseudoterrestris]
MGKTSASPAKSADKQPIKKGPPSSPPVLKQGMTKGETMSELRRLKMKGGQFCLITATQYSSRDPTNTRTMFLHPVGQEFKLEQDQMNPHLQNCGLGHLVTRCANKYSTEPLMELNPTSKQSFQARCIVACDIVPYTVAKGKEVLTGLQTFHLTTPTMQYKPKHITLVDEYNIEDIEEKACDDCLIDSSIEFLMKKLYPASSLNERFYGEWTDLAKCY